MKTFECMFCSERVDIMKVDSCPKCGRGAFVNTKSIHYAQNKKGKLQEEIRPGI